MGGASAQVAPRQAPAPARYADFEKIKVGKWLENLIGRIGALFGGDDYCTRCEKMADADCESKGGVESKLCVDERKVEFPHTRIRYCHWRCKDDPFEVETPWPVGGGEEPGLG